VEAIGSTEAGKKIQDAWLALEVVQCGYCQSGQVMSASALLARNPDPNDSAIDAAMAGNICRCGTYPRIRAAIKQAAKA
jgi:isoquinoline 1-oxidoreductase alpha subunit